MDLPKKKRCCVCRKSFRPDNRVRDRQRACGRESCQRQRRRETQARWRARNPTYQRSYRLSQRAAVARSAQAGDLDADGAPVKPPEPLRVPPILQSIPWDVAQSEIGVLTTDLVAMVALLLWRVMKDPMGGETPLLKGTYTSVGGIARKDE
jgi:hypothetical protein